jgi:type I restriction enzyme S subunit
VKGSWEAVKLGDVLVKSDEWIDVEPNTHYKEVTVRLWGRGVDLRGLMDGAEISSRRLRVRPRQFIASRIDARNGAFGLIPAELDGAVVTNDFPVFTPREDRLLSEYLGWLSRTRPFVDACRQASEGTTNRVRLKEDKFARIEIPLPPLDEQQRIVAVIERLAGKIEEARGIRRVAIGEAEILYRTGMAGAFSSLESYRVAPLASVCRDVIDCLHSNPVYADEGVPTVRSPDVGWGRLYIDTAKKTSESEYRRRTVRGEPKPGDIVLVREGGGTGKAGIVEEGQRLSLGQRVMQLCPDTDQILPRFLLHQWLSPLVQDQQIAGFVKGSASPHLNIGLLKRFRVLVPPFDEQRRVVSALDGLRARVDRLTALQAQTAAELDALLPAVLDRAFRGEL